MATDSSLSNTLERAVAEVERLLEGQDDAAQALMICQAKTLAEGIKAAQKAGINPVYLSRTLKRQTEAMDAAALAHRRQRQVHAELHEVLSRMDATPKTVGGGGGKGDDPDD